MLIRGVPPHENGNETDESWQQPRTGQHTGDSEPLHDRGVLQRPDNRVIPVHADAAEMQDRGCGEIHVQRAPHVAHDPAEHPSTAQLDGRVERHGANRDEEIGSRQADHVTIGRHAQLPVPSHARDHQSVAYERGHDDTDDHHALDTRPNDVDRLINVPRNG